MVFSCTSAFSRDGRLRFACFTAFRESDVFGAATVASVCLIFHAPAAFGGWACGTWAIRLARSTLRSSCGVPGFGASAGFAPAPGLTLGGAGAGDWVGETGAASRRRGMGIGGTEKLGAAGACPGAAPGVSGRLTVPGGEGAGGATAGVEA